MVGKRRGGGKRRVIELFLFPRPPGAGGLERGAAERRPAAPLQQGAPDRHTAHSPPGNRLSGVVRYGGVWNGNVLFRVKF